MSQEEPNKNRKVVVLVAALRWGYNFLFRAQSSAEEWLSVNLEEQRNIQPAWAEPAVKRMAHLNVVLRWSFAPVHFQPTKNS
jgi:hypothetical protein